jgi:ubiquinone/menaquinone biosynthesis C-methylase UbiE
MTADDFHYTGTELDIFSTAINFKNYYLLLASQYLSHHPQVLEIGAGIGALTEVFSSSISFDSWTCLEPDMHNFRRLSTCIKKPKNIKFVNATLESFVPPNRYDLIILADVLEHIKSDELQLNRIYHLLSPDGILLIYVPSCQYLFSAFDESIGHFRRYSRKSILSILPSSSRLLTLKSFDSLGFFLSLANKTFLNSSSPTIHQITFWDKVVVPISKFADRLFRFKFGKNIFVALSR